MRYESDQLIVTNPPLDEQSLLHYNMTLLSNKPQNNHRDTSSNLTKPKNFQHFCLDRNSTTMVNYKSVTNKL